MFEKNLGEEYIKANDMYEQFMQNSQKQDFADIEKYSKRIRTSDASIEDYENLFNAYHSLYLSAKSKKTKTEFTKEKMDAFVQEYLKKIYEVIDTGTSTEQGKAYCCLANIADYQKDKKRALDFYNKAVSLDLKYIIERGVYKNITLNDRKGALVDYNHALNVLTDEKDLQAVRVAIEHIDILRNIKNSEANFNILMFLIVLLLISSFVYILFFGH